MTSEELLSSINEPIVIWVDGRYSLSDGILVVTQQKVVFLQAGFLKNQIKETSWNREEIEEFSVGGFQKDQLLLKCKGSFRKERFDVKSDAAERFIAAVQSPSDSQEVPKSVSSPEANTELPSLTGFEEIEDSKQERSRSTETEESSTTVEKELDKDIHQLREELSASFPLRIKFGCMTWLFSTFGGAYYGWAIQGHWYNGLLWFVILGFLSFIFFGFTVNSGHSVVYRDTLRGKIEVLLERHDLSFYEFVLYAETILESDETLLQLLREEAGIKTEEE